MTDNLKPARDRLEQLLVEYGYIAPFRGWTDADRARPSKPAPRQVSPRAEAVRLGRRTYQGAECPRHGTTMRETATAACVECAREGGR